MKPILIAGSTIVSLALIAYSIGIITEQRKKMVSRRVLVFVSLGLFFDITATFLMIIGSENPAFTLHGIVGYSSLTAMLTDAILLWRFSARNADEAKVGKGLHWYTRIAYAYWLCAYITGVLIVILK
jgi:uncharacterized repeat protein (TIGR03987 family)